MDKILDLDKTVLELVKEYPEIKDIMVELGFKDIVKPFALEIMGRHMTIKKGSKIKDISMDTIIKTFEEKGFKIINNDEKDQIVNDNNPKTKEELLKSYIERLNNGEDLEKVREEFVKNFKSVSVHDIINVEQDMINNGTDVNDVQKLCDLHSALFHGLTEEEVYQNEEKEKYDEGFPINILKKENEALDKLLDELKINLDSDNIDKIIETINKLKEIKRLYQKKEELIMPLLYEYGVKGPSDVMWGVDDEIKHEYSELNHLLNKDSYFSLKNRIIKVMERTKEMIYKEDNILFPIAIDKLSLEEWTKVYFDIDETGYVFINEYPKWEYALNLKKDEKEEVIKGYINLDGGKVTIKELNAIFKLLPIDITFIDSDDINKFFINNEKVFSRPEMALNRKVYLCHPPRIVDMIKGLLDSFKSGKESKMVFWTPNPKNPIKVTYLAVRDENNNYLGALELVESYKDDLDKLKEIIG